MLILAVALGKWGRGGTIEEAREKGRISSKEPYLVFAGNAKSAWVDDWGRVVWNGGKMQQIGSFNLKKVRRNPRRRGRR
jgi:hypothetical protein